MVMYKHALRDLCRKNGFVSFITTTSWMFLSSFEKLRDFVLSGYDIDSLVDFGTELFDGKVGHNPIVAWVNRKSHADYAMTGIRLVDYCYSRRDEKETEYFNKRNYHYPKQSNFAKIPGSPVAYWVCPEICEVYKESLVKQYMDCRSGIMTGDDKYIKLWFEVDHKKIKYDCVSADDMGEFKWFPLNSGGDFRYYFGNNSKVVNLWHGGSEIVANVKNYRLRDKSYYFKKGITWGRITSSKIAFRETIDGSLFGDAGPIGFIEKYRRYLLGFLYSKVAMY